ncbi:MAG: amidohydrolase family protein [Treponema sp.]|nr:amidohydrolase family protein [Treponema sp.]
MNCVFKNGITAVSAEKVTAGSLGVTGEKVHLSLTGGRIIDLKGASVIYPGLINTHDHLQGNYLPPVGPKPGVFYLTWLPWDNDLKASATFAERSKLSREDLYNLSGYKCLFSGVTTVNDHFPHILNDAILPALPIRAIQEYCLAHEASSYDLKWGDRIEIEHEWAVKNRWPFITHLSEGFDDEAMRGVENLEKLGALDDHCLLVHCIGFSDEDIQKVAGAGASISWCPASNMFMFNVTAKIRKFLKAGINVTLGTDSSATGSFNLLEEIRYARSLYRRLYGEDLPARMIFNMITANAAKAFKMENRIGTLEEGKLADILILKGRVDDPFENLASAFMEDIELLILAGKPIYGEFRFLDLLGGKIPRGYSEITVGGRSMFISGDPAALYRSVRKKVGLKKILDFLPFELEASPYV